MEDTMTKFLSLPIAGLLVLVGASSLVAQTTPADPRVKLQVVIDRFEGETKTTSVPFFFSLAFNVKASLRVEAAPVPILPNDPCASLISAQSVPARGGGPLMSGQFVGTEVESTVTRVEEGNFNVNLQFTERALAGCRDVGGFWIPVFSNRIVAHTIRLRSGELGEIVLENDPLRNKSTKAHVTLTVQN